MKTFLYLFIFLFYASILNASDIEVIDLHKVKTLDQMILDEIEDNKIEIIEDEINISNEVQNSNDNNLETEVIDNSSIMDVKEGELKDKNFWETIEIKKIKNYFSNTTNINSNIINKEFSNFLLQTQVDSNQKLDEEIIFNIINYFYSIGQISKSYELIQSIDLQNSKYSSFYNKIEINYLLSTYQLEKVCSRNNRENLDLITESYLYEKTDIFCLLIKGKLDEAELQNSILIESEKDVDSFFQDLFNYILSNSNEIEEENKSFNIQLNKQLVFLYSAMLRIAELPLNQDFLNLDARNLAIPIILNFSTPAEVRIRAANQAFLNGQLSIESLAALYQSVDFQNKEFVSFEDTILMLENNKEKLMSFLYQYINIQIFPNQRLEALINFWSFAKENDLEEVAYPLTLKIADTIEISVDNSIYGSEIATSYIYNNQFNEAKKWLSYYKNVNGEDDKSSNTEILLNLYSTEEIDSILNIIQRNIEKYESSENERNKELLYLLLQVFDPNNNLLLDLNFEKIYDERTMPSMALNNLILNSIEQNNDNEFLIYSSISLNNKNWKNIHPQHLKSLLIGFKKYKKSKLIKYLVIEILKDFEII